MSAALNYHRLSQAHLQQQLPPLQQQQEEQQQEQQQPPLEPEDALVHIQTMAGSFGSLPVRSTELSVPRSGNLPPDLVVKSARSFRLLKPLTTGAFKWTWLWLVIIWGWISVPVFLPYTVGCSHSFYVLFAVLLFILAVWTLAVGFCLKYMRRMYIGQQTDHKALYAPGAEQLRHIVLVAIYRDEMDVVMRTLASLAAQSEAKKVTQHSRTCWGVGLRLACRHWLTCCPFLPHTLPVSVPLLVVAHSGDGVGEPYA